MSVANSRWEASATNRVDSARELGKHAISCFFDDATAMGRDQRLEDLRPASHEALVRAFLVYAHEPDIADHISR
jgi:hypothetical protein